MDKQLHKTPQRAATDYSTDHYSQLCKLQKNVYAIQMRCIGILNGINAKMTHDPNEYNEKSCDIERNVHEEMMNCQNVLMQIHRVKLSSAQGLMGISDRYCYIDLFSNHIEQISKRIEKIQYSLGNIHIKYKSTNVAQKLKDMYNFIDNDLYDTITHKKSRAYTLDDLISHDPVKSKVNLDREISKKRLEMLKEFVMDINRVSTVLDALIRDKENIRSPLIYGEVDSYKRATDTLILDEVNKAIIDYTAIRNELRLYNSLPPRESSDQISPLPPQQIISPPPQQIISPPQQIISPPQQIISPPQDEIEYELTGNDGGTKRVTSV